MRRDLYGGKSYPRAAPANFEFCRALQDLPFRRIAFLASSGGAPAYFVLFGFRVVINDFSMNPFYRNRLTRCYLGATNAQRDPNPQLRPPGVRGWDNSSDTRASGVSDYLHDDQSYIWTGFSVARAQGSVVRVYSAVLRISPG